MTSLHTKLKELRELARTSPIKINAKVPALISALEKAIGALEYIRVDIKFDRKEDVIVTKCDEALAEIAEMLEKC